MRRPQLNQLAARFRPHFSGLAWTGLDQALSSLSNVVISLAIARGGGAEALGSFAVVFAVYLTLLGFQRALITEPLLARGRESGESDQRHLRGALGCSLVMLGVVAAASLALGAATGRTEVVALGIILIPATLQDFYRYAFFRIRRPQLAALLDGLWVVASILAWPVLTRSDSATLGVLFWGAGGALGTVMALFMVRRQPSGPRKALAWWFAEARPLGGFLAIDSVVFSLATQGSILALAAILGTADIGLLRGAQIILGPAGLAVVAFNLFVLPRLADVRDRLSIRNVIGISSAAAGIVTAAVISLWVTSPILVPLLYGESLEVPIVLILAVGSQMVLGSLFTGPVLVFKSLMLGRPIVKARMAASIASLSATVAAAALFGLVAAVWAANVGALVYLLVISSEYRKHVHESAKATGTNRPSIDR